MTSTCKIRAKTRRCRLAAIVIPVFCFASGTAQADFGRYQSHEISGQSLLITSDMGLLNVTAIDNAAFEVHYVQEGVRQLPSFALAGLPPTLATSVSESDENIEFSVDDLTAIIHKFPLRVSYLHSGEPLVAEEHGYFAHDTTRGFRFRLNESEKMLGGGERVLGMNRRGQRMPLYNRAHYGYETESSQMYYSLPAVMSTEKYIIVFDNPASGWLDIDHYEPNVLQFEAVAGRTSYLVIAGASYPQLIENYTDVTGRQPLPPRWAFGNFASRFGYHDEAETRDVVRRFRKANIPLDAVVLDLYWFGPDIKGHMGNLDWDRNAFPNPEKMMADFAADGVKTIAITEPFVLTASNKWQDAVDNGALARNVTGAPKRFSFYFGETGLIDVFDEQAQTWFWQAYRQLFDQGAAGTWGDLGEPEVHPGDTLHYLSDSAITATGDAVHNAYGHAWAKMVYENQRREYPDTRPLIVMRSGFAGTQRYGIVPWTGDVSRSWGGFKPQIELSLQMSLFGLAYTHSDLGGFAGGENFDQELYVRWLQYGVFQPVYRPHAQEQIAPEPVFHDRRTQELVAPYIRLRYRLLPYIYTLAYENSTTGMPLMRPLFFANENDDALIDETRAYFWGDAFLVAPVLDPGVDSVDVPLPDGRWFNFFDDTVYSGGQTVNVPVTDETIPVLVRAGSFVPMGDDIQTTRDYSSERLTLHYYADAEVPSAAGRMYEDDGTNPDSLAEGKHELLKFAARQDRNGIDISLAREAGGYSGMPETRTLTVIVHGWTQRPGSITFGDNHLQIRNRLPRRGHGACFDAERQTLTIRVEWDHETTVLRIGE